MWFYKRLSNKYRNNASLLKNIFKSKNDFFLLSNKIKNRIIKFLQNLSIAPIIICIFKRIYKPNDEKDLMINIGGGKFYKKYWWVLDYRSDYYPHNSVYIDYNFDLTTNKPFPVKNDSTKFFYSSHTLEHIPQEHCQHIFNEFFRCLQKGGAIRITLPDFDEVYKAFQNNDIKFFRIFPGKNTKERFLDFFYEVAS